MNFFSFKNLHKQPVPQSKQDKSKGIIKWQTDGSNQNDFPQQLIQNVKNSSVGSAAISKHQEYVEGDGLLSEKDGEALVNPLETLDELHAKLSADLVSMWGISFIQRYNPEGEPSERHHIPFEECRLGIPSKSGEVVRIFHNPYYGIPRDFKDENTVWYYDFNDGPEFVVKQIEVHNKKFTDEQSGKITLEYPGQVFWFMIPTPLARVYPQPFYYSAINWFVVDAEIPSFHERNIKNNFLASILINLFGNPDDPAGKQAKNKTDPNPNRDQGKTKAQVFNAQIRQFVAEKGGALVSWFTRKDEQATFQAFPTNSHHDLFLALQDITNNQIAIGTQTPRVLLHIGQAGKLGDTQEILNAVRVMQGQTRRMRNILKRIYEKVFKVNDGTIKNVNPVNLIPDVIWNALTIEEQRNHIRGSYDIELGDEDPVKPDTKIEEVIENPEALISAIKKRLENGSKHVHHHNG